MVHFGNSVLYSSDWDKVSHYLTKTINIWSRVQLCLNKKKKIKLNPFLIHRSNVCYSKIYQKGNFRLGILDIATQLNAVELKWIERLLNPINVFWECLMLYWLNLKLTSNQDLSLLRQKQILQSSRHKNLENQNNEDFFRNYNAN